MASEHKDHIIKHGNGKHAMPCLSVKHHANPTGLPSYYIVHIPTDSLVADCYLYLNTARGVAKGLIEALGDDIRIDDICTLGGKITSHMKDFVHFFRLKDVKTVPTYEEFINGTDYANMLSEQRDRLILEQQEAQYKKELHDGDWSIAWVPDSSGRMPGIDLECLTEGRRLDGEVIPYILDAKGVKV